MAAASSSIDPAAHLGLLYLVAAQAARRIGVPREELLGDAWFGLEAAAASFDATRGLAFTTYAATRIHGAILDGRRRQGAVVPGSRRRGFVPPTPLDGATGQALPAPGTDALEEAIRADRAARLWAAVAELPPRLAFVLRRSYRDHRTFAEIGAELGVSLPRVSQLHAQAIAVLRLRPWRIAA